MTQMASVLFAFASAFTNALNGVTQHAFSPTTGGTDNGWRGGDDRCVGEVGDGEARRAGADRPGEVVQSPAAAGRRGHIARRLRFHAERGRVNDPTVEEAVRLMMQLSNNAATSALIEHIGT
jgi:hypothetical protein